MTISDKKGCSLQQAQQLISESIKLLPVETVGIKDGLHRVTSSPVTALLPRPSFDESMRDGYVVAEASALLYSLIETAKANNLEPYAYLRCIFDRLPIASSLEDYEALLPWNIELDHVKSVSIG
jgi:hypothetical protein